MNIVDTVKGFLGPDVIDKVAGMLGVGQTQARGAVNAAAPTVLGALTSVASTPDGARRLDDVVARQDDSIVDDLSGMLSSRGDSFITQGSSMMNSLLGGGMVSGLTSALGKFTGLGGGAISSLLGFLMPAVLGTLKRQKSTMGLDASGLANMLASQKQNIAGAMPAGLSSMLGSVPGFSGLADWSRERAGEAYATGREAYATGREAVSRGATATRSAAHAGAGAGSNLLRWALPLVALALITWLVINWISNRPAPTRATSPPPNTTQDTRGYVAPTGPAATVTNELTSISDEATRTLGGVTDAESAQQAVPKIQELNSRLDSLHSTYQQLPSSAQSSVSNLVSTIKGNLQQQIDRVTSLSGVGPVLNQPLNSMLEKLARFG